MSISHTANNFFTFHVQLFLISTYFIALVQKVKLSLWMPWRHTIRNLGTRDRRTDSVPISYDDMWDSYRDGLFRNRIHLERRHHDVLRNV